MIKLLFRKGLMITLMYGLGVNVLACIPPPAPSNSTDSAKLSICEGTNTKLSAHGVGTIGWYDSPTGGIYLGKDSVFITQKLSVTTTFYVQDSTCDASVTRTAITVVVYPKPKADFGMSDSCGESATFINLSKNAETYLWIFCTGDTSNKKSPKHFFGGHIHKFWGHTATLIVFSSKGCSDTLLKLVNVVENPRSDFTYSVNQKEVNFNAMQSGNTIYRWDFGDGDSSLVPITKHTYRQSGKYTVCLHVINAAGCTSKTCKEIATAGGINQNANKHGITLYPNPSTGYFVIERTGNEENITIEIVNQSGQIIYKSEWNGNLYSLDVNLANGIYLIRMLDGGNYLHQKIVVNR